MANKEARIHDLEQALLDSDVRFTESLIENQGLLNQITKLKEEKCRFEIEIKKLKESAAFRNQDIIKKEDKATEFEREHFKDGDSASRSNTLSCDFSDLYADEVSPNFVLKCNGSSIPVNTFVLSVRSSVFRDMFRNMAQEDEIGSAEIEDIEVPVLMSMLKFLYCGKLEEVSEGTVGDLYQAGDRYARGLKVACRRWMEKNLTQENCVTFLKVADSHSDQDLRAAAVSFIVGHLHVMKTPAWLTYSSEYPKLAIDVHQAYISSIIP